MSGAEGTAGDKPPELPEATQETFDSVKDGLDQNVSFFLSCVPATSARFTEHLEEVKRRNPKAERRKKLCGARGGVEWEDRGPMSPLLKTRVRMQDVETPPATPPETPPRLAAAEQPKKPSDAPPPPIDADLIRQMHTLKGEAYNVRVMLSGVCDWIEMNMPAIKPEDNRGVMVQESVIRHIAHMRTTVQGIYDRERVYTDKHADYSSKYYEHPHASAQWAKVMVAYIEEHWDQLERDWREMRHTVVLAARVLSLNMDVLAEPREKVGAFSGGAGFAYM